MNLKKARKNVEISAIPFVELSMFLLKYVNKTGVTPNQLTFMGLFFGVLASIFIGFNGYYSIFGLTMYWQGLLGAFFGLLFDPIGQSLKSGKRLEYLTSFATIYKK